MDSYTIDKIITRYKRDMEVINAVATSNISILEMVKALNDWVNDLTKEERIRFLLELDDWCKSQIVNEMMN